jgi:hypothetical protein
MFMDHSQFVNGYVFNDQRTLQKSSKKDGKTMRINGFNWFPLAPSLCKDCIDGSSASPFTSSANFAGTDAGTGDPTGAGHTAYLGGKSGPGFPWEEHRKIMGKPEENHKIMGKP